MKKISLIALALAALHFAAYAQKPNANEPKTLAVHVTSLKVSVTSVAVATKFQVYVGGGANISVPKTLQSPFGGGIPVISMSQGSTFLAGEVESRDAKTKLIKLQLAIGNPTERIQSFKIGDLALLVSGERFNDFVAVGYEDRLCAMSDADRRKVKQIVVEVPPKGQRTVSYVFGLLNPDAKQGAVVLKHSLPVTFQINAASSNSVAGYSQKPRIKSTPTKQLGASKESKTNQPISTPTAASETIPHFLEVGKGYERQADQATKEVLKADASGGSTADLIGEEVHLYQEAIDSYTKAISLAPHDPEGYILRGMAYAKRDQAGRQSVVVQSSGGGLPTAVGAVAEFGPEAIADLNQAISLAPGDAEAYLTRGRIYEAQFHNKWIVYEKSVRLGSTQKASSSVKPDISLAQNAVADFEKAIAIDPQMGPAYEALGTLYFTCFRFADALKNFQEAQKFGVPQDPNLLAKLQTIAQDPEKAGFTKSMLDQFPLAGPQTQYSEPHPIAASKSQLTGRPPKESQTNSTPTKHLGASQESNENQPISEPIAPAARLEAAIKRIDTAAALYESKGYKFAGIVATQEANENAIIGILKGGDYFKATATNWRPLSAGEVSELPKDIKEDLQSLPKNPLVWLVDVDSLRDPAFDTQYQSLLNNARRALFGTLPGSVIFTLYPPATPADELKTNGNLDPSKLAYASLNYSVLSGARSPSITNSPATVASALTGTIQAKEIAFINGKPSAASGTGTVWNERGETIASGNLLVSGGTITLSGKKGAVFTYDVPPAASSPTNWPAKVPASVAMVEFDGKNKWTLKDDQFLFILKLDDQFHATVLVDKSLLWSSRIHFPQGIYSMWGYSITARAGGGSVVFKQGDPVGGDNTVVQAPENRKLEYAPRTR